MKKLDFIFFITLMLVALGLFPAMYSFLYNRQVWNEVIGHSDEFVLDRVDNHYGTYKLYDSNGNDVCEVFLDFRSKSTAVFRNRCIVAGSFNVERSKKAFKIFYEKIPQEQRPVLYTSYKKEVLNYFKNGDKEK